MNKDMLSFIKQKFSEYYGENSERIPVPTSIERREFGFILFKERIMVRHKGFKSPREFKGFIESVAPSDVYYSAAYYERPEDSMENKGWLGADLVFDIDSDHLYTPCKSEHDYWICEGCQNAGSGQQPERCPRCGGNKFKKEAWLCETCLEIAKAETLKLLDFLIRDFGFSPKEVDICFSGHRGYHVHVEKEEVRQLDQAARKEIVDYILGTGLKVEFHGLMEVGEKTTKEIVGPDLIDLGWRGRIARGVYDFLAASTPQQIEKIGEIKKPIAKTVAAHKDSILETWGKKAPWGAIKGVGLKTWEKVTQYGIRKQAASIDTVVTTDIHRLIRAPLTLHGKTGLKVVSIPMDHLERFDPLTDAIAFDKGVLKVYVNEAHKFRLGKETFGPYGQEVIELPLAAAVYLLCKRAASLVD